MACKETFFFHHASPLFLSLFFFSMDYLLSQTYVASVSHHDKRRTPTCPLEKQVKKQRRGSPKL